MTGEPDAPASSARQRAALAVLRDPANVWMDGWVQPGTVARALGDRTNSAAVNTLNALVRRGLAQWSLQSLVLGRPAHRPTTVHGESVYRPTRQEPR